MESITDRLSKVRQRISEAAVRFDRNGKSIGLIAVSKTRSVEEIHSAFLAGQNDFGENYLQDAIKKIQALAESQIRWHFIGPIQSNKTNQIAEHFDWVHSIDRLKIAQRLSRQRPAHLPRLNLCLQINISGEPSKSGVNPEEAESMAFEINELENVRLRGLMAIPAPASSFDEQRTFFAKMNNLFEKLQLKGIKLDTLSMGMSDDLEAAISEGATMVRVGTAIFGSRN